MTVIYDDELTAAFFRTAHRIMSQSPPKTLYIALERRLNFTLENLDVSCPAYNYFRQCLTELCEQNQERKKFIVEQINTSSLPQYFQYNRIKYLELWKIASHPSDKNDKESRTKKTFSIFKFY